MYLESRLDSIPLAMVVWTLTGWGVCYIIAVSTGHIKPLLPLISMCGAKWPESSVFSLFMNGSAILSGLCTYFRFRQVQHFQTRSTNINYIWKLNVVSLLFSLISSIGLVIVANFQESYEPYYQIYYAHLVGALVTFSGGIIASGLQAALTRLMHPEIVEMKQFWSRLAVAVIGTAFYITAMVCGILGHIEKSGPNGTEPELNKDRELFEPVGWDPSSPNYYLNLTFAASEWLVGLSFVAYFATLATDFKRLKLRHTFESTHRSLRADAEIDENIRTLLSRQSSMRSNRQSHEYERSSNVET